MCLKITTVVPKLVLILFRRTCNTIYHNSNGVHEFYCALLFQQAPIDVCTSNRSRVAAGFVKTVVCTPPVIGLPPICLILVHSAICKCSMPSANGQIMQSFILVCPFQKSDCFPFRFFFNLMQYLTV